MSITPVAFRSQAHSHGLAVVLHELVRVSLTARGCLSRCLCVHLSRVCFARCEEKTDAYRLFDAFRKRAFSVHFEIRSFRGNIANLLAQNPHNKGSARMGWSHVTPEPPPPIPGGNAGPLKICKPTLESLLICSTAHFHLAIISQSVVCVCWACEISYIRLILII